MDFKTLKKYSQPFMYWMIETSMLKSMKKKHAVIDDHWIQRCWCCNQKVAKRKEMFSKAMCSAAIKAFEYAVKNMVQFVNIRDLKLTNVEYTKMNSLVRFWLAYKNANMKTGEYWIPRKRIQRFLNGERTVAAYYWNDPTKDRLESRTMSKERITINEVPSFEDLCSELWNRLTMYEWNEDFE